MSRACFSRSEMRDWLGGQIPLPARRLEARIAVANKVASYFQIRLAMVTGLTAILGRAGEGDTPSTRIPVLAIPFSSLHGVTNGIGVYRIVGEGDQEAPVHLRTIGFQLEGRPVQPFAIRQEDIFGLQLACSLSGLTSGLPQGVKLDPSEDVNLTYFGQVPIKLTSAHHWLQKGGETRTRDFSGIHRSSIGRLRIELPVQREGKRILTDPTRILYPGTPFLEDMQPRELRAIELLPEMYEDKPILRIFGVAAEDGRQILLSVFELSAQSGMLPVYQPVTLREWLENRCLTRPDFLEMRQARTINTDPEYGYRSPGISIKVKGKKIRIYTGKAGTLKMPDGRDYVLVGLVEGDKKGVRVYSFESTVGEEPKLTPFETVSGEGGKVRSRGSALPLRWFVRGRVPLADVPTLTRKVVEREMVALSLKRGGKKLTVGFNDPELGGVEVHLARSGNDGIIIQTIKDGKTRTIKEVPSVPQEILEALPPTTTIYCYRRLSVSFLRTHFHIPGRYSGLKYVQIEPFEVSRGKEEAAMRGFNVWAVTEDGQRIEDKPIKVLVWNPKIKKLEV